MIPTIHYMLRIERPSKDGSVAVYMRVTFDRKDKIALATGKTIPLKREVQNISIDDILKMPAEERYDLYYWDKKKERSVKGFGNTEKFNLFLDDERKRANDILYDLHKRGQLSLNNFKKEYLKMTSNTSLLEYANNELNNNRSEQFAPATKKAYRSIIGKLDRYRPGIALSDIDYKFLTEYENYMLKPVLEGGAGNGKCTVEKNMKVIRTFICIAIKNGDFAEKDYPFKDFKIKTTEKFFSTRDFLEPEEIIALEKYYYSYTPPEEMERMSVETWRERKESGLITPGEHKALHAFLVGIYTGLRFADVLNLTTEEHLRSKYITTPAGERVLKYYIEIDAHKTGVKVVIPLIEKALKLIDVNKAGKICNNASNQKINQHIKSIQEKVGIQKRLTFHVSRHSFATVAFEYGISEKIVQSVLGHRNRKFTEIYTHLSGKKLFFEMDKMNKGYNETELLFNECVKEKSKAESETQKLLSKLQSLDENKLKKLNEFLDVMS